MEHDWKTARCQEVKDAIGDLLIRCHVPAVVLVQHNGRSEGPYYMCAWCWDHNIRNRNARAEAVSPDLDPLWRARWGLNSTP